MRAILEAVSWFNYNNYDEVIRYDDIVKLQSKLNSSVQVKSDKELTLFSPRHNNKNNPHQNLPQGSILKTWNLAHRLNSQN